MHKKSHGIDKNPYTAIHLIGKSINAFIARASSVCTEHANESLAGHALLNEGIVAADYIHAPTLIVSDNAMENVFITEPI